MDFHVFSSKISITFFSIVDLSKNLKDIELPPNPISSEKMEKEPRKENLNKSNFEKNIEPSLECTLFIWHADWLLLSREKKTA